MARKNMSVPMNSTERQQVIDAANIESQRERATIKPTVLFRALAMAGIEQILAENAAESPSSQSPTTSTEN